MTMKDNELIIWTNIHPGHIVYHSETDAASLLWSQHNSNTHQFLNIFL